MSRQLENWTRVLNELRDRYGPHDPVVSQWQTDLETREAFEFRFPSKLSAHQSSMTGHPMRDRFASRSQKLVPKERRGRAAGR